MLTSHVVLVHTPPHQSLVLVRAYFPPAPSSPDDQAYQLLALMQALDEVINAAADGTNLGLWHR